MKTIIITGTSSGIGLELAEELTKKGHKIIGLSRKIPENTSFKTFSCDITNHEELNFSFNLIKNEYPKIDILINNAGMGMVGTIENTQSYEIIKLLNLNLIAPVQLMNQVLPIMRNQKQGKIINISSIGSEMGLPFRGFYSASKSALDRITEAIRYELFPFNIQVCSVHLGDIKTNIAQNRVHSEVLNCYEETFNKVYESMNSHVNKGSSTKEVADYLDKLINKDKLKAHYFYGKFSQKLSVSLKKILPQSWFESLIKKYSNI